MSLYSLFVDLKANTADFVSGMSTASYAAKRAGRDIQDSFSALGSVAERALAPFGALGAGIAGTLSSIGSSAAAASAAFSKLGGGMSAIAVAAGAAAGAAAAIGAGAAGIAIHAAESADKMLTLSKQTGLSVSALSTWSFIAKQSGVDQEAMAKALQFLSANMLKAATAAPGAVTAFDRLGISVRDSSGNLRNAGTVMEELLKKLGSMKDQAAAVGFAKQLGGKGGAAILGIDPDEIDSLSAKAQQLGIVLDTGTAVAAHKFVETLGEISSAGDGLSLSLARQLLPALQAVASALASAAENKASGLNDLISGFGNLTKVAIGVGDVFFSAFEHLGAAVGTALAEIEEFATSAGKIASSALHFDWGGIERAAKEGYTRLSAEDQAYSAHVKEIWSGNSKFISGIFAPAAAAAAPKGGAPTGDEANTSPLMDQRAQGIQNLIAKLVAQAQAELDLAAATGQSLAGQNLQKAAGQANEVIAELTAIAMRAEGAERTKLLAIIQSETNAVRALTAEKQVATSAVSLDQELTKESRAYDVQISSLGRLSEAYAKGGAAIAAAKIQDELQADREKVQVLADEYGKLAKQQGVSAGALAQLMAALDAADAQLRLHQSNLETIARLKIEEEIQKETAAFEGQVPALAALAAAYLKGADAVRAAQVQLKVAEFQNANPGASPDQVKEVTALHQKQSDVGYAGTVAQEAAHFNLSQQYADEIEKLTQIRALLEGLGASTLAVDAAIYDANQKNIQQWDQAALKVGSVTDKFHALFNQVQLQGQNFGQNVFASLSKSIDDISTQLAKFVVTGKSNFKELFTSLEESLLKASFQATFAKLTQSILGPAKAAGGGAAGSGVGPGGTPGTFAGPLGLAGIFGKAFGLSGTSGVPGSRPDGSSTNPFYVISSSAFSPGAGGGSSSPFGLSGVGSSYSGPAVPGFGGLGGIASLFSNNTGAIASAGASYAAETGSDVAASGASDLPELFSEFGGFMAGGGDVTPGKAYMVGEKGPEPFFPKTAGRILPTGSMKQGHTVVTNVHIHGVSDMDSFRKSQGQIQAEFHRTASAAATRNG
jgi:Lambda phage tail tape-measure protein (Tape_meas_lam_C)